jgi:catechol 2,3-dioxygenase-like lactoylglutathione lyase family enzyme
MVKVMGLDHVVLRTGQVDRMIAFYRDVLGCTEERRVDKLGLVQLRAGSSLIDLVDVAGDIGRRGGAAPGPEGRNMDHFCVRVADFDSAAIKEWLASHGVDAGEVVTRYGAEGDGPSLYIEDPDGNTVELKGPPEVAQSTGPSVTRTGSGGEA